MHKLLTKSLLGSRSALYRDKRKPKIAEKSGANRSGYGVRAHMTSIVVDTIGPKSRPA